MSARNPKPGLSSKVALIGLGSTNCVLQRVLILFKLASQTPVMTALEPLLTSLQLAGLPSEDFKQSLEQACLDSNTAETVWWLGSAIAGKLAKDGFTLQSAGQQSPSDSRCSSLQPTLPLAAITAMVKDQETQGLLEPDVSDSDLQQSVKEQENSLLLLQDQLSSLKRLSTATSTQAASSQQAAPSYHQQHLQRRSDTNKQRLEAQQAALNTVLTDVQETASSLCTQAERYSSGGLLALSDLTRLRRESAALNQAFERCTAWLHHIEQKC